MDSKEKFGDKLTLINGDGEEVEFDVAAGINYEDDFYLILVPTNLPDAPDNEAYIFKYIEKENDDPDYELIVDNDIIDGVFEIYTKLLEEDE